MDVATPRSRAAQSRGRGSVGTIGRTVGRSCSRPGCPTPAASTLVFSYGDRTARLVELLDERDPQAYDLCEPHATRTRPPHGWEIADDRPARPTGPPLDLDDEHGTVAILAAALRGETSTSHPAGGRDAAPTGPTDETEDVSDDPDEDPLRAALEEVQRVVVADPHDEPSPAPTPLRRRRVLIVDADDPDAEPTLW